MGTECGCDGGKSTTIIKPIMEFEIPFKVDLSKSVKKDGRYEIYIGASDDTLDQETEIMLQKALMDQKDFFLKYGVIDWDHMHKRKREPEYIIGEPQEVRFTKSVAGSPSETYVKGFLYEHAPKAQDVIRLIESGSSRLGASVGGGIYEKSMEFDSKLGKTVGKIKSVRWDHVAITPSTMAVNINTSGKVRHMPIGAFAKSLSSMVCNSGGCYWDAGLEKSMQAGIETDSARISGGQALQAQSLEGSPVKLGLWGLPASATKSVMKALQALKCGSLKGGVPEWVKFLKSEGLDDATALTVAAHVAAHRRQITNYLNR